MGFGAEGTPPGNESGGGAESKAAGKMAARTRMVEISVTWSTTRHRFRPDRHRADIRYKKQYNTFTNNDLGDI
jgi:hypothetical protein